MLLLAANYILIVQEQQHLWGSAEKRRRRPNRANQFMSVKRLNSQLNSTQPSHYTTLGLFPLRPSFQSCNGWIDDDEEGPFILDLRPNAYTADPWVLKEGNSCCLRGIFWKSEFSWQPTVDEAEEEVEVAAAAAEEFLFSCTLRTLHFLVVVFFFLLYNPPPDQDETSTATFYSSVRHPFTAQVVPGQPPLGI